MQEIETVYCDNSSDFKKELQKLLDDGYKILSTDVSIGEKTISYVAVLLKDFNKNELLAMAKVEETKINDK